MVKQLKKLAEQLDNIISIVVAVTFTYFIWLSWRKLTDFIGDGWLIWIICLVVVIAGLVLGKLTGSKIMEKFGLK